MHEDSRHRELALAREALAVPAGGREDFLRTRCGADADLLLRTRAIIDGMLSATIHPGTAGGATSQDDLADPQGAAENAEEVPEGDAHAAPTIYGVAATSADLFESSSSAVGASLSSMSGHPDRLGNYRIIGVVGEGGMGMVYLAEQERPRRTVALKVVRAGMLSGPMLKRFELESQVLGRLQHPGIAQVFEAGVAALESGGGGTAGPKAPYFAMEYVRGQSLTEHAAQAGLDARQRLELVAKICDAVQHAHSRGVIHRDLKPGNILVTPEGQPKVLDFGVARATDSDIKATMQTDAGQLVGTLPYMSPEQVAGDAAALDTRSDVYTLGVILYELLSGSLPLDLGGKTIVEAARRIVELHPPGLGELVPALRGDVSTIVAKAMEKDRQRRYQTASELAADIGRYLRSEPITARPPTTAYQVRKFAARNKGLVAGASLAVVLLVLGVVGTSIGLARAIEQKRQAELERTRADDEARSADAINDFLINRMLLAATPEESQGRQITVSEVVGKAAGEIDAAFADRPQVKARMYGVVGRTYTSLGEYDKADKYMAGAVELRRAASPGGAELAAALHELGSLRFRQTRWQEALSLFEEAATLFASTGKNDSELIESRSAIAAAMRNLGRLEEAEKQQRLSIAEATARLGPDHATTLSAVANLAIVLHDGGRVAEAEKLYRQVADARKRVLGMNHPATLMALGNLAAALYDLGDIESAERTFTESLEIRKKVSGPDHPETIFDMSNLAVVREKLGRTKDAEALYREALALAIPKVGEKTESVAVLYSNLAGNLAKQGLQEDAEANFRKAVDIFLSIDGPEHAETLQTQLDFGKWLLGRGRLDEAGDLVGAVHDTAARKFGAGFPVTVGSAGTLAQVREKQGKTGEALTLAQEALAGRTKLLGPDHAATREAKEMVERLTAASKAP